jgi:hypothetical protein
MNILAATLFLAATASAGQPQAPGLADIKLERGDGGAVELQRIVAAHRLTVVVFFSATCPCFAVHGERLRELARELSPRGVELVVVDSERHAPGEARPQIVPGTQLPILRDEGGRLARRLGAQYATESFVFDANGQLRYRGGIDDQRKYLGPNPKPHLREALLHLLDNNAPAFATAKALGCTLRLM